MKRALVLVIVGCMLCVSMSSMAAGVALHSKNADVVKDALPPVPEEMEIIKETVDKYLNMDEYLYEKGTTTEDPPGHPQPVLGNGEIFGLWITIEYDGNTVSEKINIDPRMIWGKLTDPGYRTPIKFDVDDDPDYDIETGFGFFRYGVDEMHEDGSTTNHAAWATAFDFYQIGSYLDDQLGELEVWQEFHVNLALIKNSVNNQFAISSPSNPVAQPNTATSSPLMRLINRINQQRTQVGFAPLNIPSDNMLVNNEIESIEVEPIIPVAPLPASEDYIVTRVGYRSPAGQKIPLKFEKIFAVERGNIFRPFVFQHEMNPNDIIGTASNDVMFGFQAYQAGHTNPSFDVEFDVNFDPAVYTVTQFIPREGKILYYYHDVGVGNPLDITFSSNLLKGFNPDEEEEGTLSLTLTLDAPGAVTGPGKWMMFEPEILGDTSPFGGKCIYAASHIFDVGLTVNSPRFEEKIDIIGIPKSVVLLWGVDAVLDIVQGEMLEAEIEGFVDLTMSSSLDDIILYYPKSDPEDPDVTCLRVSDIPSSRELRAGASLDIDNGSMLKVDIGGFVSHTMSSQLGDITLYWPKADPYDPDAVMAYVPGGSFLQSGRTEADATLYVDSNPDNFWTNDQNYFRGSIQRTASSDFGRINVYLPNIEIPILEVYDIPGNALGSGKFWWNQLRADIHADRTSAGGQEDPIKLNLVFNDFFVSNELRIGNGYIDVSGKIAEDGWFYLDTSDDMLENCFEIKNYATDHGLRIEAGTISADNFEADWSIDTSGPEIVIEDLSLTGKLSALRNFFIDIELEGDPIDFEGDWSLLESGEFNIDFNQNEPLTLNFDLSDYNEDIDFSGYVILDNDLHFDVCWQWRQGEWGDHAYFKINENSNQANIDEINLYFTYNDTWGADITLYNGGIYICLEWCWLDGHLYKWPVIDVYGTLDFRVILDFLTNYQWIEIV